MKLSTLESSINKELKKLDGDVGLYIKFLDSGEIIKKDENKEIIAASVIKLPILIEFYNQVKSKKINISSKTKIDSKNLVKGSGIAHILNPKTEYFLEDLAKLMVILSDNAATNQLIDILKKNNINKTIKSLGLIHTILNHKMMLYKNKSNLITAKEISTLFEKLYLKEIYNSEKMLDILNEVKDRDRIPKYIKKTKISHKTGSGEHEVHDAGIVFAKEPFIFTFLSHNLKIRADSALIAANCAKLCFDYANK